MRQLFLPLIALVALTASCARPAPLQAPVTQAALVSAFEDSHGVHWTYTGEEGPTHWGDLAPPYAACKLGSQQSPVDVPPSAKVSAATGLGIAYRDSALKLTNNGHTVQAACEAGSVLTLNDKAFELKQFHFHTPSEHKLKGKTFAMEMHLVHQAADGNLAIMGVLFEEGGDNAFLKPVWGMLPAHSAPDVTLPARHSLAAALPTDRAYFTYAGSLTTPPCTEHVTWAVLKSPVTVSRAQVDHFRGHVEPPTARPIQPLNGRL